MKQGSLHLILAESYYDKIAQCLNEERYEFNKIEDFENAINNDPDKSDFVKEEEIKEVKKQLKYYIYRSSKETRNEIEEAIMKLRNFGSKLYIKNRNKPGLVAKLKQYIAKCIRYLVGILGKKTGGINKWKLGTPTKSGLGFSDYRTGKEYVMNFGNYADERYKKEWANAKKVNYND